MTTAVLRAGRQAGTMLKGVCSWAHKLTHSTDVFWNNTGVNNEHLQQTKKSHCTGRRRWKPTHGRWYSWPTEPEPKAQRWHPWASNCRVISHIPPWRRVFESPLRKTNKEPKRLKRKETTKQKTKQKNSNITTGIRIGGKTFFLSSRIKVYMKISHASC